MSVYKKCLRIIGTTCILSTAVIGLSCMIACSYTQSSLKLAEHSMNHHAVISTEYTPTKNKVQIPVHMRDGKYYVLAESVVLHKHVPLLQKIDIGGATESGTRYEYHHNTGFKAYYEVKITNANGKNYCVFSPSLNSPTLPFNATPTPTFVGFMPVSNMVQVCEKEGNVQIFNHTEEKFSWRTIYAVPAAGIAFVVIDVPSFALGFTGYLIKEMFFEN